MKKTKGFTLIELIVVIAIIGVLAAILVPAMMGWVMKSRVTSYNNNASEICTQLQVLMTDLDQQGKSINGNCTIEFAGATCVDQGTLSDDIKLEFENAAANLTDISHARWAATIKDSTVQAVVYTENNCKNLGGFPVQCTKDYISVSTDPKDYLDNALKGWS